MDEGSWNSRECCPCEKEGDREENMKWGKWEIMKNIEELLRMKEM